jgi:hypothetical protein
MAPRGKKVATLNRWRETALRTSVYVESRRVLLANKE